nr:MAG TPA: Protein of unknown function (DUF1492) [Caudoviricetes sp.]DAH61655.1 MAG TPA: Protein of unknown function (DUF1492) [Caudoviricetes sp.]
MENEMTYLDEVKFYYRKSRRLRMEIDQLKEMSRSIKACQNTCRVQTSRNNDPMGTMYVKIESKEEKLEESIQKYMEARENSVKILERLDEKYYDILFGIDISNKTVKQLSEETGRTERHIYRLYAQGKKKFQEECLKCLQMSQNVSYK